MTKPVPVSQKATEPEPFVVVPATGTTVACVPRLVEAVHAALIVMPDTGVFSEAVTIVLSVLAIEYLSRETVGLNVEPCT